MDKRFGLRVIFCCHSFVRAPLREPFFHPGPRSRGRRAQRRSRTALLWPPGRLVLDGREHGGRLVASGSSPGSGAVELTGEVR